MHEGGPCFRLLPSPTNVLAEMTDFMLIHIYPALITLQEVRSKRPDFHAKGWHVPTPVQCCLTLLAETGTGTVPAVPMCPNGTRNRQVTSQGGTLHGTWHPCPS